MEYPQPDRREIICITSLAVIPVTRTHSTREKTHREKSEYDGEPDILLGTDIDIASERVVYEVVEISEYDQEESYENSHREYIFGSVHGEFFSVWGLWPPL